MSNVFCGLPTIVTAQILIYFKSNFWSDKIFDAIDLKAFRQLKANVGGEWEKMLICVHGKFALVMRLLKVVMVVIAHMWLMAIFPHYELLSLFAI